MKYTKEQFRFEVTGTMQEIIDLLNKLGEDIRYLKQIEIENCVNNEECKEYLKEMKKWNC